MASRINTPKPGRWSGGDVDPRTIRALHESLDGTSPQAAKVCADALDRVASIDGSAKSAGERLAARRAELTAAVAAGSITAEVAAEELAEMSSLGEVAGTAADVAKVARRDVVRTALRWLRDHEADVFSELDGTVVTAAATILDAVPIVEGIDSDADAGAAEPKIHKAWRDCTEARARIEQAWLAAYKLRSYGCAHVFPGPPVPGVYWRWRTIEPVLEARTDRHVGPVRQFVDLIAAGAVPGALTAFDVAELHIEEPVPV